jgi:hypothetical protein
VEPEGAVLGTHSPSVQLRPAAQWLSSSQLARQASVSQA